MSNANLKLGKYSIGTGDRFAHQAKAQLQACVNALTSGVQVEPVWNKSNREHNLIGSEPASTRGLLLPDARRYRHSHLIRYLRWYPFHIPESIAWLVVDLSHLQRHANQI